MGLSLSLSQRRALSQACLRTYVNGERRALGASVWHERGPDARGRDLGVRLGQSAEGSYARDDIAHKRLYRQSIYDGSQVLHLFGPVSPTAARPTLATGELAEWLELLVVAEMLGATVTYLTDS